MHYVESPHRLPYEMASGILQAEIGCSYNRCRFCSLCRKPGKDYRPAPREEVEADLDELASYVRRPTRIYLYGGNPFGMPRGVLIPLLERIHEKLPEVKTTWAHLGVQGLSIGAESAYDPALKFMRKAHTATDLEQQCARLSKVGIDYTLFYLAGIAGAGKCSEAARASAEVFSRINPGSRTRDRARDPRLHRRPFGMHVLYRGRARHQHGAFRRRPAARPRKDGPLPGATR